MKEIMGPDGPGGMGDMRESQRRVAADEGSLLWTCSHVICGL